MPLYNGTFREPTEREQMLCAEILRLFGQLQSQRATFEAHWEEVAELVLPEMRNTFTFGSFNTQGEKKTDKQIDANGMVALSRFGAICDSLLTPRNMKWHGLEADNEYVMKDRQTQLWFESTTRKLFRYRYAPLANFSGQNQSVYKSIGAFGTGPMFIDKLQDPEGSIGLRYKALPVGQVYLIQNHQGIVNGFVRWFKLTAAQAEERWPGRLPPVMQAALEKNSLHEYVFLHYVRVNKEYNPGRLDAGGKLYKSCYMSVEGKCLMQEGGYNSFPLTAGRFDQAPEEIYGRGPAMLVLPSLKTLNAEKRVFLKQGHRAADPVLLTADDGLVDFSMRPGALNKGGWSSDGKPLVGTLPTGDIQISEEMMAEEKAIINDAFFVTLFQIMTESPQMTATEVIERVNEKGILLAPTVGRQQTEYLGPMIHREINVLSELGVLDPMPPRLREARGEYTVVHTSPLSRAMRAQEAAGFLRTVENVKELVNITQDPSLLDPFEFDVAIPAIADIQAVPPSWMAGEERIAQKRENRARDLAEQRAIQAAPAEAAMMKAEATQVQAGMRPARQRGAR